MITQSFNNFWYVLCQAGAVVSASTPGLRFSLFVYPNSRSNTLSSSLLKGGWIWLGQDINSLSGGLFSKAYGEKSAKFWQEILDLLQAIVEGGELLQTEPGSIENLAAGKTTECSNAYAKVC